MKFVTCEKQDNRTLLFLEDVTDNDAFVLEAIGFQHIGDKNSHSNLEKWERQERLSLDLGWAKLIAEKGEPEDGIQEIYVGLETDDLYQDIAVVGTKYDIKTKAKGKSYCEAQPNCVRLLVWEDPDKEDYTREVTIALHEE